MIYVLRKRIMRLIFVILAYYKKLKTPESKRTRCEGNIILIIHA